MSERANYLALGGLIRERLMALTREWPTLTVLPGRDLAQVAQDDSGRTTIHVLYLAEDMQPHDRTGRTADGTQTWGCIISVRDLRDGTDAEATAGQILTAIQSLLQGWAAPGWQPLLPVSGPAVLYQPKGVARYPCYFTCRVLSRGV
jgi:hypothetical protein